VVADEVHLCANADAAQSRAVKRIASRATAFAGLSGTLITHDFGDVYQVLAIMDDASWPSKKRYRARYLLTRSNGYAETVTGLRPEMEHEFFACLEGQLIRRAKADVLDWLPPKIYSVRRPDMPPQWRHAYDTMEAQMLAELPDGGGDLPVMNVLTQLTRLSQLASSAADVEITWEVDEDTGLEVPRYHVTLKRPCWKAETLLGILAERPGQPTAVFTESRQLALLAGEYCTGAGLRTGYVTGTGGGITTRTRQQAVADFQAGVLDVIMCTAGAGGTGITLTAANCGVMMQRPYKYDLAVQPEDRQHRPGSEIHDHVEIIDLVTKDTVDQRRRDVLRDKAGQLGQLLRDVRVVKALLGGLD
jgi:SNF2 family DNA or RNA helicase